MRGSADKSYGINVAKMAGLPKKLLKRAEQILIQLESSKDKEENQFTLFGWDENVTIDVSDEDDINEESDEENDEILKMISEIDVDCITPRDALNFLFELKDMIKDRQK